MHAVTSLSPGSLMHRFVTGIVAVLLTLHVIGGCCWHHAHGDDSLRFGHSKPVLVTGCSHTGHGHSHGTPGKGDHHKHPCDEPECVFSTVSTQKQLDCGDDLATVSLAIATPYGQLPTGTISAYQSDAIEGLSIALPVRRHLLFSTLLI